MKPIWPPAPAAPPAEWRCISDATQLALSQQALMRAALIIAEQADLFAAQFGSGIVQDRGAADALRLFANLLRETTMECLAPVGRA